jgi:hypothetical protein
MMWLLLLGIVVLAALPNWWLWLRERAGVRSDPLARLNAIPGCHSVTITRNHRAVTFDHELSAEELDLVERVIRDIRASQPPREA